MVRTIARVSALILLGVIVATVGVGAHRAFGYVGVGLGLVLVAMAGVFSRAWGRWPGFLAYAGAWAVMTIVYGQVGPAHSMLIVEGTKGGVWIYGGALVLILVAIVPRRWLEGRDVTP